MNSRTTLLLAAALTVSFIASAQNQKAGQTRWGDQGDGTYINPVLNADYSDPDVIRVGKKYYMVASDFHFLGMQILESDDLVNWTVIAQLYDRFDLPGWDDNRHFSGGSWAPSIRYHAGRYWVYFCTPDEGLFMTNAKDPRGPWAPLCHVKEVAKWEDPCPVWDDKGNAYLGRSCHGAGPIILHRMSQDGTQLLDEGDTIYTGPVAEGTKFFIKDGYYYLSIPEGGVGTGWQTVLRSKDLYGPYEKKIVLEQGTTDINGPHQGAFVETKKGEWWFYHFQEKQTIGRVVHMQPVYWKDGWPVVGVDYDGNGVGEPVTAWTKPDIRSKAEPHAPQTSDDFNSTLGLQWQFCHNPHDEYWKLSDGSLQITAQKAYNLMFAHNMITQKCTGNTGMVTTILDASDMQEGQRAGLLAIGNQFYGIGMICQEGKLNIYMDARNRPTLVQPTDLTVICLGVSYEIGRYGNTFQFWCGPDADSLEPYGETFSLASGFWKGCRFGLYTYNTESDGGTARFDWFEYPVIQ